MRWLAVASVVLATGLVYGPGLNAPFVFDDLSAIVDNPQLRQLSTAFDPPPDTSLSGRPLVHATFALSYALAELTPAAHRIPNVLLHGLNALLLWSLLVRVLRRPQLPESVRARGDVIAGAAAALWTLHPLQTEAVVYLTQRTELLASSAILATLHCVFSAFERPHERQLGLFACLLVALGSGCKETLVSVPLLALCLDLAFFSASLRAALSTHRFLYLSLLLGLTPLFALTLSAPRGQTAGFGLGISALDNLALQGRAIAWYLRLAAWPDRLSVSYNWPIDQALARYWPADLLIGLLFALTLWLSLRRRRGALLGWWFFIVLAPSSSFVPILSEMVAERRMYLALASVTTLAVLGVVRVLPSSVGRAAAVGCSVFALACAARSGVRVHDYRSEIALFTSALAVAPDNPQALWVLGHAYEKQGDLQQAAGLYERMAERRYPYVGPASWGTRGLMSKANLQARLGQHQASSLTLQRALAHDPSSAITRMQHAAAAAQSGEDERARSELQALLEQPFLHDRIQLELGLLELRGGHEAAAKAHFAEALRLAPGDARIEERIGTAARAAAKPPQTAEAKR